MDKMANELKISVVTVCYNAVNTIEETILSVINQTYDNVEYIIIDGGSTDGTVDIIRKYADGGNEVLNHHHRITYWVSEPDRGIYDAMNKGIAVATGDYINFMNAGDTFHNPAVLERFAMSKPQADILGGIAKYVSSHKKVKGYWIPIRSKFKFSEVRNGGIVNHQATFIKKSTLSKGYDLDYPIISDELFLINSLVYNNHTYKAYYEIVSNYNTDGLSNGTGAIENILKERNVFYQKKTNEFIVKYRQDNMLSRICLPIYILLRRLHQMVYLFIYALP